VLFEDDTADTPEAKQTGQLPDWYLGLEALDTSDAPEWFSASDAPDAQSSLSDDIPPWINDMLGDAPLDGEDAPAPTDEVGSFFDSIGGSSPDDEEAPQISWFDEEVARKQGDPDAITDDFFAELAASAREEETRQEVSRALSAPDQPPDETPALDEFFAQFNTGASAEPPSEELSVEDFFAELTGDEFGQTQQSSDTESDVDDFFAELGSARAQPQAHEQDWQPATPPQQDDFADFDDFPEDEAASGVVEIPQNELDAFFDNLAAGRAAIPLDEIEDPDLDWVGGGEPEVEEVEEMPLPPVPPVEREDTMDWLNELSGIVTSVTRPLEPPPEVEQIVYDTGPLPESAFSDADARSDAEAYVWPEPSVAETVSEEEPAPPEAAEEENETAWLDAISPEDAQAVEDVPGRESPPPPRRSLLSERLRRRAEKQSSPQASADDDEEKIFRLPSGDPEQDALIPEDELHSGWMRDDLFTDEDETPDAAPEPPREFFVRVMHEKAPDVEPQSV
jgi:hypothetical protein